MFLYPGLPHRALDSRKSIYSSVNDRLFIIRENFAMFSSVIWLKSQIL